VIKFYRGRGELTRDSTVESVSEQANIAITTVCMGVDIALMNQQRRLADDQQRRKYPVIQSPMQHAETCLYSSPTAAGLVVPDGAVGEAGVEDGAGSPAGFEAGAGVAAAAGFGAEAGAGVAAAAGFGAGVAAAAGVEIAAGFGAGAGVATGVGADVDPAFGVDAAIDSGCGLLSTGAELAGFPVAAIGVTPLPREDAGVPVVGWSEFVAVDASLSVAVGPDAVLPVDSASRRPERRRPPRRPRRLPLRA
jgi:hypothetical protein